MQRLLLFALTNIAVLFVFSVIAKTFGLDVYLAERGGSRSGLLWLSGIFGFGGTFISLAPSAAWQVCSTQARQMLSPPAQVATGRSSP